MDDNLFIITILTVGVIIFNIVVAIRAIALAMAMESGCQWVCRTIGHDCVMKVLFGTATLCFILAILKIWSAFDMYMDWYVTMSPMFRIRMFAYLAENYGVAMLGYAVISLIKNMTRCSTSVKYDNLKQKVSSGRIPSVKTQLTGEGDCR